MKIIITESQYNNLIQKDLDEDYPSSWSIDEFKKLTSFSARVNYCNQHLQRLASGSSRIVYKVDDTKVLKLAKNKKGLAQNETEIDFGRDSYLSDIVAKIFDFDENGLWVEMELAQKLTPAMFKNIVGVDFENYCEAMRYRYRVAVEYQYRIPKPENMDEMWENDFVYKMMDMMVNYELILADLCKITSYGLVDNNRIVLIDSGLTNEVFDTHYIKSKSR